MALLAVLCACAIALFLVRNFGELRLLRAAARAFPFRRSTLRPSAPIELAVHQNLEDWPGAEVLWRTPQRAFSRPNPVGMPDPPPGESRLTRFARVWFPWRKREHWREPSRFQPMGDAWVARLRDVHLGYQGIVYDWERLLLPDTTLRYAMLQICVLDPRIQFERRSRRSFHPVRVQLPAMHALRVDRKLGFTQRGYRTMFCNDRWSWRPAPNTEPMVEHYPKLASIVHESGGYWHFTTEALPRLAWLKPFLDRDPEIRLLVDFDFGGSCPNEFVEQYLDRVGIDPGRVVHYDHTRVYHADELFLPSYVPPDQASREALLAGRNLVLGTEPSPKEADLIIVINRRDALSRRSDNISQLIEALRRSGAGDRVVEFVASELSIDEQIDLFRRARLVVGPHGAAHSNIIFASPGTRVIEIQPARNSPVWNILSRAIDWPAYWAHCWHMCAALDLPFWCFPADCRFASDWDLPAEELAAFTLRVLEWD